MLALVRTRAATVTASQVTIRPLGVPEHAAADALLLSYLPGSGLDGRLDAESRLLGAWQGDTLVACLHWTVRPARWRGRVAMVAQTGPGATAPSYRGRGLMRRLLHAALAQMRTAGIALAGQETPLVSYHRGTGWEIGTFAWRHQAARPALLVLPPPAEYRCRQATAANAATLAAIDRKSVV